LYEEDTSDIVGQETETGTEGDIERLASILMQFAEYYLAVKLLEENKISHIGQKCPGQPGFNFVNTGKSDGNINLKMLTNSP
jgi:hypothetical protein